MIERIILPEPLRRQIEDAAHEAFPRECCGLLEGVSDDWTVRVTAVHPARNLATDADRFEIDPADEIRVMKQLRGTGRDIVGCYHSHPNGRAEPSPRDLEGAFGEGFVWVIVALKRNENETMCPPPPRGEAEIAFRDFGWGEDGAARKTFEMRHRPPPGSPEAQSPVRRHGSPTSPQGGGGQMTVTFAAFEIGQDLVGELSIRSDTSPAA